MGSLSSTSFLPSCSTIHALSLRSAIFGPIFLEISLGLTDVQPFLEASNSLHSYFPPREWAVRLPAFLLLSGVGAIGLFFGKVMMNEARKKRGGGKKV